MRFSDDQNLVYAVESGDRWQLLLLTYWIAGKQIVSNQSSQPHYERTAFRFIGSGELVLSYDDGDTVFTRIPHLSIDAV